jgi:hypothetical protein
VLNSVTPSRRQHRHLDGEGVPARHLDTGSVLCAPRGEVAMARPACPGLILYQSANVKLPPGDADAPAYEQLELEVLCSAAAAGGGGDPLRAGRRRGAGAQRSSGRLRSGRAGRGPVRTRAAGPPHSIGSLLIMAVGRGSVADQWQAAQAAVVAAGAAALATMTASSATARSRGSARPVPPATPPATSC